MFRSLFKRRTRLFKQEGPTALKTVGQMVEIDFDEGIIEVFERADSAFPFFTYHFNELHTDGTASTVRFAAIKEDKFITLVARQYFEVREDPNYPGTIWIKDVSSPYGV